MVVSHLLPILHPPIRPLRYELLTYVAHLQAGREWATAETVRGREGGKEGPDARRELPKNSPGLVQSR